MKSRLLKKFEDQIHELERELKTELPKEIQRARELGDLRENAEYQAAKERQTFLQARIGMLRKRLGEIAMLPIERIPADRVGLGSTVQVRENNATLVYYIVMPEDADATRGFVSTSSPIGRALLNKREGDEVQFPTPNGPREFEIVKLTTIHDE
jgi:transcription elongation factor GreA